MMRKEKLKVGATTCRSRSIRNLNSPRLDKGLELGFFKSDLSLSRLIEYGHKRRDFALCQIPITGFTDVEIKQYEKLFISKKNSIYNVEKRFYRDGRHYEYCYFITLTFNDKCLNRTSENYRRKQVAKFLKDNFCSYIANVDFGDEKEREHYHAICYSDIPLREIPLPPEVQYIKCPDLNFPHGFIDIRKVYLPQEDKKALSRYMVKLKLHSTKFSTHFIKPIYSRKERNNYENKVAFET